MMATVVVMGIIRLIMITLASVVIMIIRLMVIIIVVDTERGNTSRNSNRRQCSATLKGIGA